MIGLGQSIGGMTHGRVDDSDLYRFALLQSVAALDSYVHGVTLDRAVDLLMDRVQAEPSASKIGLHFGAVRTVLAATTLADREIAARTYIAERLAKETFQKPNAIGDALATVGIKKVWTTAFGQEAQSRMTDLSLVVARRDRIVHECDNDVTAIGSLMPLSATDAVAAVDIVEGVVGGIDPLCV